jgi:hypothetical protein
MLSRYIVLRLADSAMQQYRVSPNKTSLDRLRDIPYDSNVASTGQKIKL